MRRSPHRDRVRSQIAASRTTQPRVASTKRLESLLEDARKFFEAHLWEAQTASGTREMLAAKGLKESTLRKFGVGYAPVGPAKLLEHLAGAGYSEDELVDAGLAARSPRGRVHTQFRSRVMFPIRDAGGRTLGFAALGTHLGPSWALWITSPDGPLFQRSKAVFGIDRAAARIARTAKADVLSDCIEVLRAHQAGRSNAVTVHTATLTAEQLELLSSGVDGGADALELGMPPGLELESSAWAATVTAPGADSAEQRRAGAGQAPAGGTGGRLKRIALVVGTGLAAINVWTGAPLLAVWVGSQVQAHRLLSLWGVVTVVAVLALLAFLLAWALAWMSAKYDQLTGRPALLGQTSPWHRQMRGELDEQVRRMYGLSAPEKVLVISVLAAVPTFEVWFFFFAGSPLGGQ
jgi:DNA primase catalytic core, N-terminal domain